MKKFSLNVSMVWFIFVIFATCSLQNDINIKKHFNIDTLDIINTYFKDDISVDSSRAPYIISYCPDNTCIEFLINEIESSQSLNDFVYLLFYYDLIYNYPIIKNSTNRDQWTKYRRCCSGMPMIAQHTKIIYNL